MQDDIDFRKGCSAQADMVKASSTCCEADRDVAFQADLMAVMHCML
jgi:hypothetical protein